MRQMTPWGTRQSSASTMRIFTPGMGAEIDEGNRAGGVREGVLEDAAERGFGDAVDAGREIEVVVVGDTGAGLGHAKGRLHHLRGDAEGGSEAEEIADHRERRLLAAVGDALDRAEIPGSFGVGFEAARDELEAEVGGEQVGDAALLHHVEQTLRLGEDEVGLDLDLSAGEVNVLEVAREHGHDVVDGEPVERHVFGE